MVDFAYTAFHLAEAPEQTLVVYSGTGPDADRSREGDQ